ncbi:MAG: hypothetical protein ACLTTJ_14225 [Blautia sp.]
MPEMDGHEATHRIRALKRPDAQTVRIVAMTAQTSEGQHSGSAWMREMDEHMCETDQ